MLFYHLGMLNHYLSLAYKTRVKMRKNETGMAVEHGLLKTMTRNRCKNVYSINQSDTLPLNKPW